mmetsp:Transcript_13000/g.14439  ORF Transcript_13000/g.14439 Transcript_13000/m.14439 type:complete len:94 (+) Transcript_13000:2-283(+)
MMQQQSVTMMNRMMGDDSTNKNDDDADTNFRYNTMYVPTEQYLLPEQDDDSSEKRYDNGYHYYGRADTVYRIGKAFGTAMIKLEEQQQQQSER